MNKHRIKRHYFDMRQGAMTVGPFFQMANFLMLAYLTISEYIPIWIFAPLFIISVIVSFTIVGNKFRKHQSPTDINLMYERSTEAAGTVVQMMEAELVIMEKLGIAPTEKFLKRLEYMKNIEGGKL